MEKLNITIGMLWAGRYELRKQLGRGSFACVWLAYDVESDIEVALKIFAPDTGMDEQDQKAFRDEYRLMFNLNHTNVLHISHYDVQDNRPYIVLPFCSNGSAEKLVGKATEEQVWDFMEQVAAGLNYLHRQTNRIIHQDIKPANILINAEGQYLISDFGISLQIHQTICRTLAAATEQEKLKAVSGTLAYMGPERFTDKPRVEMASDIWSLGASAYELLENDVPFGEYGGDSQLDIQAGQPGLVGKVPAIKAPVSDELKTLIYSCLEEDTWQRPSAGKIVEICRTHREPKTVEPTSSHHWWWKIMTTVTVLALVVLLVVWLTVGGEDDDNQEKTFYVLCEQGDSIVDDMQKNLDVSLELVKVAEVDLCLERARERYTSALTLGLDDNVRTSKVKQRLRRMADLADSCRVMVHLGDTVQELYNEGRVPTADYYKEQQRELSLKIKKLIFNL